MNAMLTASSRKRGSGGPGGMFFCVGGVMGRRRRIRRCLGSLLRGWSVLRRFTLFLNPRMGAPSSWSESDAAKDDAEGVGEL